MRLLDGDDALDAAVEAAAEAWIQPSAISAASSLALLRFLPSYQNRAATVCPLITTRLDQAVRPPGKKNSPVSVGVVWGGGVKVESVFVGGGKGGRVVAVVCNV